MTILCVYKRVDWYMLLDATGYNDVWHDFAAISVSSVVLVVVHV
jgi:hypothetical protein